MGAVRVRYLYKPLFVLFGRCFRGAWEMEDRKLYEYLMVAIDCAVLCYKNNSSVY